MNFRLVCYDLPEGGDWDTHSLAVGLLELAHLSCLLDPEVDLVAVLADNLQLDVLGILAHFVVGLVNAKVSEMDLNGLKLLEFNNFF